MEGAIPESVARLIAVHIRSLEQLEILLLLAGKPEQWWSIDAVYDVVRSSRGSVAERLDELRLQGVLAQADGKMEYRYWPQSPELADAVQSLSHLYKERRVKIVEMIYAPPPAEPLKGFADAFKFKKEK